MLTYGKRKKSSLPSFSSLRDSTSTSRSKANANKKRETSAHRPTLSVPVNHGHDETIDEMAKMLLDDTSTVSVTLKEKVLPQLPPDDAWAQRTAGEINEMQLYQSGIPLEQYGSQSFIYNRELVPPIPRRSSKRKSVLQSHTFMEPKDSDNSQAATINAKVQAMIDATKALKGDGKIHNGPLVPTKNRRIQNNKVIIKVRDIINDHINARNLRKRHDPVRDDHLLDASLNELQDEEDLSQFVSAMDIRLNEGDNLKNPKVACLTGHGYVSRKPVADDGRSIRSRKSSHTDPFSERPDSSCVTRTPGNLELSLRNDMSMDPCEGIPDLPTSRSQSPRDSLVRPRKLNGSRLANDTESCDVFFSSSPLAQSTPRIRLESKLEKNGRTVLKHVPASPTSAFDTNPSVMEPEMDLESSLKLPNGMPSEMDDEFMVTNSQSEMAFERRLPRKISFKDRGLFKRYSTKSKKHPSPSKAELEGLQKALKQYPSFGTSRTLVVSPSVPNALASKNPNAIVREIGSPDNMGRVKLFPKAEVSRSGASMSDIPKRKGQRSSMIPRPADITAKARSEMDKNRFSMRDNAVNFSEMDIDELQWNDSRYDMKQ